MLRGKETSGGDGERASEIRRETRDRGVPEAKREGLEEGSTARCRKEAKERAEKGQAAASAGAGKIGSLTHLASGFPGRRTAWNFEREAKKPGTQVWLTSWTRLFL